MSRTPLFASLCLVLAAPLAASAAAPAPERHAEAPPVVREADGFRSPPIEESLAAGRRAILAAARNPDGAKAAPTAAEVGDADSFGNNVRFLGLLSGGVYLGPDCAPDGTPISNCVSLAPSPNVTSFSIANLASITLPGKSTGSLLCHWQTPVINYFAYNDVGYAAPFLLRITPVYTIESEVFSEVTDPTTGLPYPGMIQLGLTGVSRQATLQDGAMESDLISGSRVCIGGLVSHASLVNGYGFTNAQAKKFFKKPITIRLGIQGMARLVDSASITIGTRFTGDAP